MSVRMPVAFAATLAVAATACQPAAPAELSEADRAAILAVHDEFLVHLKAGDMDQLVQLYAEDAVVMPPNHPAVEGRAAIAELFGSFPPITDASFTDLTVEGAGDLAYVLGHYVLTFEGMGADTGKFIEIRRRQADGSWPLVADIFNSDLPLPTME